MGPNSSPPGAPTGPIPSPCSEGCQSLLPGLGWGGVVQDPLELHLQVPRLEQAGALVEPHLEKSALVVDGHVPAVREVLEHVCGRGQGGLRQKRGSPAPHASPKAPAPHQVAMRTSAWPAFPQPLGIEPELPCLSLNANHNPMRHFTEDESEALGNHRLPWSQKCRCCSGGPGQARPSSSTGSSREELH